MSTTLQNGFQKVFGTSPKGIYSTEARINRFQGKLDYAFGSNLTSKYWSQDDLDQFCGAGWTSSSLEELSSLSVVWISSLVDKENMHRLPELTAYLALHYPQVDDFTKPALELLDKKYESKTTERSGFTDCHVSEAALGRVTAFAKNSISPDYVRFRCWYDALPVSRRVAFACYLALGFIQLCNKTVSQVLTYMQNHAMHDFQTYWGVPANNLMWIPSRSVSYLKSYFQPRSQLLVTVLRPFLRLREQLIKSSTHTDLLDSLNLVLFSPTQGKGLELVEVFHDVVIMYDLNENELLNELPYEGSASRKRLEEFLQRYGLTQIGTWYWAQYFDKDYFVEFQIQDNGLCVTLLSALIQDELVDDNGMEESECWVNRFKSKYVTRKERASTSCFEGFWDGARRLDYA